MIKENDSDQYPAQSERGHNNGKPGYLRWVFIVGGIAVGGLLIASICWPNLSERTKFFTGNLLNLVIALAVIAQVLIYRKQWESMRDALRRQETDLRQWIEIQPFGIGTSTSSKSEVPTTVTICLRWKVLNNTRLPFTVEKIDIKICRDKDWEVYEMVESETISPAGHNARNFYPFFVSQKLTKNQTKEFFGDGIGLSVAIRITWVDAIGERQERTFGDLYECGVDYIRVIDALGKTPTLIRIEEGGEHTIVTGDETILNMFTNPEAT